jgi:hypothetical protein
MAALELFALEVFSMLSTLRELDEFCQRMDQKMAVAYLSQHLLNKQTSLSPKLELVRKIAARLALDDVDSRATYPTYIEALSSLISQQRQCRMRYWFRKPPMYCFPRVYGEREFKLDLLTAAVHTGKDAMVRELREELDMPWSQVHGGGVMGNVYTTAAMRGDFTIISYLLDKAEIPPDKLAPFMRMFIFPKAYEYGSPLLVQQLLASTWHHEWTLGAPMAFFRTCVTPNVDNMKVVERFVETRHDAEWCEHELRNLIHTAASRGWDDMADYLAGKGAPCRGTISYYGDYIPLPLIVACQTGSVGVVRHLVRRFGGNSSGMGEAAKKGFLEIVKVLVVEGRSDVNNHSYPYGTPPGMLSVAIVGALMAEHTEMVGWLVGHGATLEGPEWHAAMQRAKHEGLDSMVALLKSLEIKAGK